MGIDYIVVGAGSAGCVMANRLSEDGAQVVLLEAGPKDRNPMIHIPAGVRTLLYHPKINWNYSSEPEAGSGGTAHSLAARQGAGRIEFDQRHAICPR